MAEVADYLLSSQDGKQHGFGRYLKLGVTCPSAVGCDKQLVLQHYSDMVVRVFVIAEATEVTSQLSQLVWVCCPMHLERYC